MTAPWPSRLAAAAVLATTAALLAPASPSAAGQPGGALRVCADPNNLPFSNDRVEGFENKLAKLFARDLGKPVSYTWWAQRRGFIRHTLKAESCDVVMGVPLHYELVATTRPYYRSGYVFVSRTDRHLDVTSITDPRLKSLRIGVQLVGADGFNTPPAQALAEEGIVGNVVGYTVYGDYREPNPPARIITAVETGEVDIAAVWGPLAGYFSRRSPVPLTLAPVTGTERFAPLAFQFDIAVGVRKGDVERREELDRIISRRQAEIARILADYGVPEVRGAGSGDRLDGLK